MKKAYYDSPDMPTPIVAAIDDILNESLHYVLTHPGKGDKALARRLRKMMGVDEFYAPEES